MCGSSEARLPRDRQGVVKRMYVAMRENLRREARLAGRGNAGPARNGLVKSLNVHQEGG
jgi:hypothetical protein